MKKQTCHAAKVEKADLLPDKSRQANLSYSKSCMGKVVKKNQMVALVIVVWLNSLSFFIVLS